MGAFKFIPKKMKEIHMTVQEKKPESNTMG